jgi:hypothetical protein
MTNFEVITEDEFLLALWLSGGRMDCDMCPVEKQCGEGKSCFELIHDWLKSEA